jgi:cysteine desulfurase
MTTPSPAPRDLVYLDHAATAPLCARAEAALRRGLRLVGNPSSRHGAGLAAHEALVGARDEVARLLGCAPDEVVFTGGGSEAINLALHGTFAALGFRGHLVTTAIEHSAVLECADALSRRGVAVTVVGPAPTGHVDPAAVAAAIRPDTVLVSVMHANNETGAVQPVEEITALAHAAGALMHVDAVQTAGKLPVDGLAADLVSISAHKFGGPKGVGALRVADRHTLAPLVRGGGQEAGRRAGTENVAGVLGMAGAAAWAAEQPRNDLGRAAVRRLRKRLLDGLAVLGGVVPNATGPVMPETVSVSFSGVRGDTLADLLDAQGICVSTGSACHAGQDSPSHVLTAMGVPVAQAKATIRYSFGKDTAVADIDAAVAATVAAVRSLRRVSGTEVSDAG